MKIRRIRADWLHVPIPEDRQHTTDFGRIAAFDSTLVRVETEGGLTGFGEAKAAVYNVIRIEVNAYRHRLRNIFTPLSTLSVPAPGLSSPSHFSRSCRS